MFDISYSYSYHLLPLQLEVPLYSMSYFLSGVLWSPVYPVSPVCHLFPSLFRLSACRHVYLSHFLSFLSLWVSAPAPPPFVIPGRVPCRILSVSRLIVFITNCVTNAHVYSVRLRTAGRRWEITCACTYRYMALPFGCPPFFSCQASLAFSLLLPSLWHRVSPLHLWFISVFVCLFFCSHLLVPISYSLPFFPLPPFFPPLASLLSSPPLCFITLPLSFVPPFWCSLLPFSPFLSLHLCLHLCSLVPPSLFSLCPSVDLVPAHPPPFFPRSVPVVACHTPSVSLCPLVWCVGCMRVFLFVPRC